MSEFDLMHVLWIGATLSTVISTLGMLYIFRSMERSLSHLTSSYVDLMIYSFKVKEDPVTDEAVENSN